MVSMAEAKRARDNKAKQEDGGGKRHKGEPSAGEGGGGPG